MPNKAKYSKELLEREYIINKKTPMQISEEYGSSYFTVLNSLKRYNIPVSKRKVQTQEFKDKSFKARFKGCGEISGYHICCVKNNAKRTKREFNLTAEYLWNLFLKQNRKCYFSGVILTFPPINMKVDRKTLNTASIDRIDCSKGYIEGNVRWVHKNINRMRSDFTDEEFIEFCRLVTINQGE